ETNPSAALYVGQRGDTPTNLIVLPGPHRYVEGRRRMLTAQPTVIDGAVTQIASASHELRGFLLCVASIVACAGVGILAKETAVMLPLYALLIEWLVFRFDTPSGSRDKRLIGLFVLVLLLPMIVGLTWLLPGILNSGTWATRNFT